MAILISAKVPRSGKIVVFGITGDTPGTTGFPPLAQLTAVAPTGLVVYDNGTPVALGPATWADGTNGADLTGSVVAFYVTGGPIGPGHTVTFDAPAGFLVSNGVGTGAVAGGAVVNRSGLAHGTPEGAWGHFPGIPTAGLIPVGWNTGQNPVNVDTNTFFGKDKMLEANGYYVFSGSGGIAFDGNGYPASWTSPSDTVLGNSIASPSGGTGLANDKGYANSVGVWTSYHIDSAHGTPEQKTVAIGHDPLANGYVAISLASTTTLAGGVICQKWDVAYSTPDPSSWNLRLKLQVSAPSATGGTSTWTISNPCNPGAPGNPYVVAPRAQDGAAAATPDFTKPYAIDDNVLASWVTGNGVGPLFLRAMDSFGGAQPLDSRIYKCDLVDINRCTWQDYSTYTAIAGFVRKVSTDGLLTWQTTRVCGPQALFITPDTSTFTLGVTLTAGSNVATLTSGTPELCGSSVTGVAGTGSIPAGTLLAHFAGSRIVFDDEATASGAATVTLQRPNYLPVAAGDNGQFVNAGMGGGWAPMQVRFATPHPFTTWQLVSVQANHNAISFTNGLGSVDLSNGGAFNTRVWVHDAYTISFVLFVGPGGSVPAFTAINSNTEYDFTGSGGWTLTGQVSGMPNGYPDEFLAAACKELGSDYWVNFEDGATDRLYAERARRIVAHGGTGLKVRLEYKNELWNGANPYFLALVHHRGMVYLGAYLPTGTTWLHYYNAVLGQEVPFTAGGLATGPYVLYAAYAQLVFTTAWTTAGASGSNIMRVMGTGFSQPGVTQDVAGAVQLWGAPCDAVVYAPYFSVLQYASIINATNPADGNWPVDAYIDFFISHYTWNFYVQSAFATHDASFSLASGWGQPPSPLIPSVGGSGSSLNGGGYSIAYTYVDGGGNETTPGQSEGSGFGISTGNVITTQMPPVPPWVAGINLYLGASDQTVYRLTGFYPSSTVPGTPLSIASYNPAAQAPPNTNGAADSAGTPPVLGTYEGFPATIAPVDFAGGLAAWGRFEHDCRAHPGMRDLMYAYLGALQIGEQATGVGPEWANLFEYYYPPAWTDANNQYTIFATSFAQSQLPGPGTSNTYASAQGWAGTGTPGVTPDGADHNGGAPFVDAAFGNVERINDSPGAQGVLDWMGATTPTPTPAPTVAATSPASGAAGVSVSAPVAVTYSGAMDASTLTLTLNAASVPRTGYNSGTFTATFTPGSPLSAGTSYAASADGSGADGTPMASPHAWSFATAPTPTPTGTPARRALPGLRAMP